MNQLTEEQRERVEESQRRPFPDPKKVEAGRKGGLKRQDNWRRGVKECETCGKLSADLNNHPCFIAADNAATAMRDACVEKVRELAEVWKWADENSSNKERQLENVTCWDTANKIAAILQSLTLDQVQEKR